MRGGGAWWYSVLLGMVALPAALGGGPLLAQQAGEDAVDPGRPADGTVYFDTVDVELVNLEVFVSDDDGPVSGLTLEDFELLEDGRPITISHFRAIDRRSAAEEVQEVGEEGEPGRAALRLEPVAREAPTAERLHLVIFFDNLHLRPFNRNRVIRQCRSFLERHLGPGDRVMVVSFERSIHVRQEFTDDLRAVVDALYALEETSGFAVQAAAERDQAIQSVESSRTFEAAEPYVDFYAKQKYDDVGRSVGALGDVVEGLAGLPGRKAVLHVSDGLPMVAGADLYHLLDLQFGESSRGGLLAQRYSVRDRVRALTGRANAHGVTFYALEATGLRSHASAGADSRSSASGGSRIEMDVVHDFNHQETLQVMAGDTGGQAAFNTNNLVGALDRVGRDFAAYYSIGFTPGHGGDGRLHRLKVKVARRGLEVRHRTSYRSKSVESRLGEQLRAVLHHGWEYPNLGADAQLEPGESRGDGTYLVPVTISIPFASVALVPRGDMLLGRLRILSAVVDEEGDASAPETTTLPLDIPRGALAKVLEQDVVYTAQLLMRPGRHVVAVGVRDDLAGTTAFLRREVRIGR